MSTAEQELLAEIRQLETALATARDKLMQERFKDIPTLAEGTKVLVKRKLFGQFRWWPAKISHVHLDYMSGTDANGEPWERKTVSYGVFLQQKDGEYGGTSQGYYAHEVQVA